MDINDNIKNRSDLKSYFLKNAIPTESNFAEFIESVLNQREDGLVKAPGTPLSIEASGDASSQKKAINFYWDFVEDKPHWVLSLNPRSNPVKPETARPGFSISDTVGHSRLFIDRGTGYVGIGTIDPKEQLEVNGNIKANNLTAESGWGNWMFLKQKRSTEGGGGFYIHNPWNDTEGTDRNRLEIAYKPASGNTKWGQFVLHGPTGNVGIGTTNPSAKLEINGFTESLGISVNNAQNTGVGRGVWLWSPSDSNHVIYSANPNGKSPANAAAVRGHFDAGHRLRFRTYYRTQGFLFENSNEQALVDIDSDNGNLWTKGSFYCGGTIVPAVGNSASAGIQFPTNPGGGSGDAAWIRYYPRSGEATTFEIGTSNDANDHIALMASGKVGIGTREPSFKLDVEGSIRFGGFTDGEVDEWPKVVWYRDLGKKWDEGLIKHGTTRGFFKRSGFGIHIHQSRDWHVFSSGWRSLLGVEGSTGTVRTRGALYCGNSDIYFTHTNHNHSAIGNTEGYAAIENAKNYDALMILGRAGTDKGRKVRLWDYLQVNGQMEVYRSNTQSYEDNALTVRTQHGYATFGSLNSEWFHMHTDRPNFYFNKPAHANGGFHTYSARDYKKDIRYLSSEDEDRILSSLAEFRMANFRYKDGELGDKTHIGILVEEAPEAVVTEGGKSIDLYDYVSYGMAALKALQRRLGQMEARLQDIE